jgi:general stress protein YciG
MEKDSKEKPKEKSKRGLANVSPERRREIASKGGKAAHAQGKAHVFTSEEAREANKRSLAVRSKTIQNQERESGS